VSNTYTICSSSCDFDGTLGSPPRTIILLFTVVMVWPDRGDGDGPMFWNVYHLRDEIRNAARSPKSKPSDERPPNMYITSLINAAACPSLGDGM
jgi:hypothetical protein